MVVRRQSRVLGWLGTLLGTAALLSLLLTGGCATGSSDYACAGCPSRPLCLSAKQIYQLSEGSGPPPASETRPSTLSKRSLL